jgi:hydroxyacylglutathione hydrolase
VRPAPSIRQLRAGREFADGDRVAAQMASFSYVLVDEASRTGLLVDPAYAPTELAGLLDLEGIALAGVVLTHYHPDHAGGRLGTIAIKGIAELLEHHDVPVHVQRAEVDLVARSTGVDPGSLVAHDSGDRLGLGESEVVLIHTPGHTPGSQCLLVEGALLTGDTLFLEGCGRTDLPGGDAHALYDSLFNRLGALDENLVVLTGHDYSSLPSATLAYVRAHNPSLAPASEATWVARHGG